MATAAMNPASGLPRPPNASAVSLLAMLSENKPKLIHAALVKLLSVVDTLWFECSESLPLLEEISEDANHDAKTRAVASAVASRVFFHLEEYRDALRLALGAGDEYFNVVADKNPYIETLVCKAIGIYTKGKGGDDEDDGLDGDLDEDADDGMSEKVVGVVEKMFERCYVDRQWTHALGIALEAKNIDKVLEIYTRCDDLDEKLASLKYGLSACTTVVTNKNFRTAALKVVAEQLKSLPESHLDYASRCMCDHLLGNSEDVWKLVYSLLKQGGDSALMAFQLCFDLVDTGDQHFVAAVAKGIEGIASEMVGDLKDGYDKCIRIMLGGFAGELELAFLYKESDSDPLIMKNLKKALEEKSSRNSMLHSMSIHTHAFLNAGTTGDTFLRENLEFLKKASNWAKFSASAGLGCIYLGHIGEAMELLDPYLPAEGATIAPESGYSEGGALMALGLIHAKPNCPYEKRLSTTAYLRQQLRNYSTNEIIAHGAATGIGLSGLGCRDPAIFNELKDVLYTDSAVAGEAAGLAMGMVMLGNAGGGDDSVTEMLAYAKDTSHEKIIRGLSLGIALMHYGLEAEADGIIEQLSRDRDPVLRYGGMYTIALAYCGTGSNKAIKKLLSVAISDVSNEVRMGAIIGLAFILFKTPQRVPELVKLLLVSFNPHVRYASCMAVGIAMAGTADSKVLTMLEEMMEDLTDFVRQGAMMATSMVLMQSSDSNKKAKAFRTKITGVVSEKHQPPLTKMGAILSQGILDAGGRNVTLSMGSRNGFTKPTSVVGIMLFMQHWFWHPCTTFLSLAFQPTLMAGLNKDLNFVKKFNVVCGTKPSAFAYPARLEEKKEEEKKRVTTVTLSTTAKAKAKEEKKKKEEEGDGMDVEKKEEERDKKEGEEEKKEGEEGGEKEEKKKKKGPEPKSFEMSNPSRMTKAQAKVCSSQSGQRYSQLLKGSVTGIVMLTDSTPAEEDEEVEVVKAPSVEEDEASMPEPFIWRPEGAAPVAAEGEEEAKEEEKMDETKE